MGAALRLEEIYDASTDENCFEQLSVRLAETLGARSGVVHWRPVDATDGEEEISYSGHFSSTDMERFGLHFADDDLWSNAVRAPAALNRVWNCEQLVPPSVYENSRIYNEWIRPLGDDSFHAIGAALRTASAVAEIGFHRGKGQGGFAPSAVVQLGEYLAHIARSLEIRARLHGSQARLGAAAGSLDVVDYAVFSLAPDARVLHHNAAADAMLQRGDALRLAASRLTAVGARCRNALKDAIDRAGSADAPLPSALRIASTDGRHYAVSVVAAPSPQGRRIVVAVQDSGRRDRSLAVRARALWGLTPAEAEVALRLSEGASPKDISDERQTSLETIRTQIKSLSAKMGMQRQTEVIAALKSLPRLFLPPRP